MADYMRRLETSGGGPRIPETRPRSTPAPPSWGVEESSPFQSGGGQPLEAPTVIARAPGTPDGGAGAGQGLRRRDVVIFGAVVGLVIVAAVVTILLVLLRSG